MGQRTQIWIEDQQLRPITDEKGEVSYEKIYKNYCLHEQWGFGKGLVNRLINLLNRSTMETYKEYSDGIDWNHFLSHDTDLMREYRDNMWTNKDGVNISDYQIRKIDAEFLKEFMYGQDNDNGYMIIRLGKERKPKEYTTERYVEIGFYIANKENKTLQYVSMEEYLDICHVEPAYVKYAQAAVEYYSGGQPDLLIRDVLSTWETPLSEMPE